MRWSIGTLVESACSIYDLYIFHSCAIDLCPPWTWHAFQMDWMSAEQLSQLLDRSILSPYQKYCNWCLASYSSPVTVFHLFCVIPCFACALRSIIMLPLNRQVLALALSSMFLSTWLPHHLLVHQLCFNWCWQFQCLGQHSKIWAS